MSTYERFVLIDDNEADNVYHEIMIRRAGFTGEIRVFECGPDAIAFFRQDDLTIPTGVFLDINMPMMNGFEVAASLAPLLEDNPAILLMMLTSSSSPADRARAQSMPLIKDFLTKPLSVEFVKALLNKEA